MKLWEWLRGIFFRFDAEWVHEKAIAVLRLMPGFMIRFLANANQDFSARSIRVDGATLRNRLGLAAGFDKNALLLPKLPELGFGFVEIGTVTPLPQPGNPKPRLFRSMGGEGGPSLFNCLGFNSDGAETVAKRVAESRSKLPPDFRIGVNVGKNRDTPIEKADQDYVLAASRFENLVDFVVVNVSSPNTPQLRSLQNIDSIRKLAVALKSMISDWKRPAPLYFKLAPEIDGVELAQILGEGEKSGVDGWVLTNTLGGSFSQDGGRELSGGWSGRALCTRARRSLELARKHTKLPLISVGGILSVEEAKLRFELGADLIEIYSGWVFNGPRFPSRILKEIGEK